MAGTTLYLIRSSNILYARQDNVIDVYLSGKQTAYSSLTGVASTDVVTISGATLADGMLIIPTSLTGGSGVSAGVGYYAINSSGSTCKLSQTPGGSAVNFTTDITAGSVIVQASPMQVWSTEFRDIFDTSSNLRAVPPGTTYPPAFTADIFDAAAALVPSGVEAVKAASSGTDTYQLVATEVQASISDEKNHYPLRQTLLNKTFWIFDRGASATPRYLPAEYQEGDIIATSPPNTP